MSKVVRIIFEYKEHVIHKNADGTVRMGVSLDIRSTGIKQKGDGPAMILGWLCWQKAETSQSLWQ